MRGRPARTYYEDGPYTYGDAAAEVFVYGGLFLFFGTLVFCLIMGVVKGIGEEIAKKDGIAQKSGRVSLSHKVPIRNDVVAWVELDGKRVAEWPSGAKEVEFDAAAGKHELAVYSTFQGEKRCILKDSIRIEPDQTLEIEVVIGQ